MAGKVAIKNKARLEWGVKATYTLYIGHFLKMKTHLVTIRS